MVLQGSDVAENIVFLVQDPLTEYTVNIINRGQFYPVLNAYIIKGQAYFRVVNGHQRETKVYPLRKKINIQLSMINNISENQGKLILNSIKEVSPAGIKKYSGEGSVNIDNNISFKKIMKIGAKWDRISGCYDNNYSEIFSKGLPYLENLKKKTFFF